VNENLFTGVGANGFLNTGGFETFGRTVNGAVSLYFANGTAIAST
jgi:hypothetical protein